MSGSRQDPEVEASNGQQTIAVVILRGTVVRDAHQDAASAFDKFIVAGNVIVVPMGIEDARQRQSGRVKQSQHRTCF